MNNLNRRRLAVSWLKRFLKKWPEIRQADVARKIGINPTIVWRIVNDKSFPTESTALKILAYRHHLSNGGHKTYRRTKKEATMAIVGEESDMVVSAILLAIREMRSDIYRLMIEVAEVKDAVITSSKERTDQPQPQQLYQPSPGYIGTPTT